MSGWQVAPEPEQPGACGHAAGLVAALPPPASQCEDCVREGTTWVHLRRCLTCQHVGCCDSSPMRHATAHWQASTHPVVASAERREHWAWCYADQLVLVHTD